MGVMAKFGLLESKRLCAVLKGMLDKLFTQFLLVACATTIEVAAGVGVGAGNLVCDDLGNSTVEILLLLELLVLFCPPWLEYGGCLLKATFSPKFLKLYK